MRTLPRTHHRVYLPQLASLLFPLQPFSPHQTTLPNAATCSTLPLIPHLAPRRPSACLLRARGPDSLTPSTVVPWGGCGMRGAYLSPTDKQWWQRWRHQPRARSAPSGIANYCPFYGLQHCTGTQSHPSPSAAAEAERKPCLVVRAQISLIFHIFCVTCAP